MTTRHCSDQRGFTLTEILVAMVIALIGILMMFRIMENSETRKRTTGAGSDAQTSGAIAMYALERDLRPAGNGFGGIASASLGCTVTAYDAGRGANFNFPLLPVQIEDGADGASDVVTTLYGGAETAPLSLSFNASTINSKSLDSNGGSSRGGLMMGDIMLVVSGASCGLIEITDNTHSDARTINHGQAAYPRHYPASKVNIVTDDDYEYISSPAPTTNPTPRYNAAGGYHVAASGTLFNLGRRDVPRRNIWQITNGNLTVTDDFHNGPQLSIGDGVVNMQAQYGLSTSTPPTWQATAPADWATVVAVRVALLVRSQQYEKENVNANTDGSDRVPSWSGGAFTMTNLDGTADSTPDSPNNWRRYRYRVYETVVPLRNNLWGQAS
jgi:type IV pilus assembly protein PilW